MSNHVWERRNIQQATAYQLQRLFFDIAKLERWPPVDIAPMVLFSWEKGTQSGWGRWSPSGRWSVIGEITRRHRPAPPRYYHPQWLGQMLKLMRSHNLHMFKGQYANWPWAGRPDMDSFLVQADFDYESGNPHLATVRRAIYHGLEHWDPTRLLVTRRRVRS